MMQTILHRLNLTSGNIVRILTDAAAVGIVAFSAKPIFDALKGREWNTLPVIGVPGDGGPMKGTDALHSIVQMPPGIPVATVGVGNGRNAGYLATHILALIDDSIRAKLVAYRESLGDSE